METVARAMADGRPFAGLCSAGGDSGHGCECSWPTTRCPSRPSMSAVRRSSMGAVAVGVVVVATGCGGSAPARDPAAEARVVSETNAFCRHLYALPAAARRSEEETLAIQHSLAS